MISVMEDMLYNTPYSLCGFCRETIPERREARWVDIGAEWRQISCVECAGKHPEDKVDDVIPPDEVYRIIEIDEEMRILDEKVKKITEERIEMIKKILKEEGYEPGLPVHFRSKKYIVTGIESERRGVAPTVNVVAYPAKKDGTASKQNKHRMSWTDFIRLWRMQRADVDGYIAACERHEEECRKRRMRRITDDQL